MSMDKTYRVVFLNLLQSQEAFLNGMNRLGVSGTMIERIIQNAPVILKGHLTPQEARRYAKAVQDAGGRVTIQEEAVSEEPKQAEGYRYIEPFESFTMCPECGFKQLRADTCEKCGFPFKAGVAGQGRGNVRGR